MFPYEAVIVALLNLVGKIIDGQPPDVKKQLWEMYLEDAKAWRAFWAQFPLPKPPST